MWIIRKLVCNSCREQPEQIKSHEISKTKINSLSLRLQTFLLSLWRMYAFTNKIHKVAMYIMYSYMFEKPTDRHLQSSFHTSYPFQAVSWTGWNNPTSSWEELHLCTLVRHNESFFLNITDDGKELLLHQCLHTLHSACLINTASAFLTMHEDFALI